MKTLDKVTVTSKQLETFVVDFITELNTLKESFRKFDVELEKALPDALKGNSVSVEAVYSHDRQHILLMFKRNEDFRFEAGMCTGDVFDVLDITGTWKRNGATAFRVENGNVNLKDCMIGGMKPFELYGDQIDIIMENLEIDLPYRGIINIDYAFAFSCKVFYEKSDNLRQYVEDLSKIYWDYFKENKPKELFLQEYEKNKKEMERLFFDETVLEKEIDDFISENNVILEQCLGLIKPLRQVTLENIHGDNPKDFKPDLIAFDCNNKNWKIVDYKRAKRTIIKNPGKARAHFKVEVTELEAQLYDYMEYFVDKGQREYFEKKYNCLIEYPEAIGLIGNVSSEQEKEFNRIKSRLPRWLDIIPYNYLYERYCRYLETTYKVMNS
ncbi:hypothetical protein JDS76_00235 [Bacillus cereus]|uniref:hypothetical protein n=1 Tax=Bacillus cereus TaxID=1396 RepID=UPI0018F7A88F|nr:hypothetical protein [Bacillus cereus]MBJ8085249.1 hypothetical protein [Bacillus cereus]MCU4831903.1 hypothetical protein [Bacillus cereus]